MHRLLVRPVSRAVRVHAHSTPSKHLARSFTTTSSRKFGATSPVNKRNNKNLPPADADFFGEALDRFGESGPSTTEASSSKSAPQASRPATSSPSQGTLFDFAETPFPGYPEEPPTSFPGASGFNATHYFESWSWKAVEQGLAAQGVTLLQYMMRLVESDVSLDAVSSLDPQTQLELRKRWISYELDQGNEHAHLPLLEFFLHRGLQFHPPQIDSTSSSIMITKIDPMSVEEALSSVEGPWQITSDVAEKLTAPIPYPDLMTPDALLDPRDVLELPPSKESPFHNRVTVRNHRSVFHNYVEGAEDDLLEDDELEENENQDQDDMMKALPVSSKYYGNLHQSILMRRGVVLQTGKGKIRRVAFMVLVGDGDGLVGYGEGKHSNGAIALNKARLSAVRDMDWVERFEKRTIWTEMSTKLGATQVILRPRPVGFGLRCNPHLHRILRAAGLKDISAKVWGSRNKLNVIKAAFRLLHAGHAPTGMGDGVGGKGKKLSKGGGLKSKSDVERARGRKLINLRK